MDFNIMKKLVFKYGTEDTQVHQKIKNKITSNLDEKNKKHN